MLTRPNLENSGESTVQVCLSEYFFKTRLNDLFLLGLMLYFLCKMLKNTHVQTHLCLNLFLFVVKFSERKLLFSVCRYLFSFIKGKPLSMVSYNFIGFDIVCFGDTENVDWFYF